MTWEIHKFEHWASLISESGKNWVDNNLRISEESRKKLAIPPKIVLTPPPALNNDCSLSVARLCSHDWSFFHLLIFKSRQFQWKSTTYAWKNIYFSSRMLFECPIITGTVAICFTLNKLIIFSLGGNRNSRLQDNKEEDNSKFQPMDLSWRSYQNDRTLKLTDQGSELFAL